ncbi:MAG: allose kinase [Eubacteriales bacterium]|nr:allose kinase [Eubacteriales bacterium]
MPEKVVIGIDIGGTKVRIGTVNEKGSLMAERVVLSETLFDGQSADKALGKTLREYMEKLDVSEKIAGVSIGLPATLSKDRKVILSAPNIPSLDGTRLSEILEEHLHIPVFMEKDVNYLLFHDMQVKQIKSQGIVIGCYLGTGFGNAVFINGIPMTGRHGAACELGHIPIAGNRLVCSCGNEGCIETIASGRYLRKIQKEYFEDTPISMLFERHYRYSNCLKEFIENLALPIATEINIFDPDVVVIGGGLPSMKGFPKEDFEAAVRRHTRKPYPMEDLQFLYSVEDDFGGVRGAGMYIHKMMEKRR